MDVVKLIPLAVSVRVESAVPVKSIRLVLPVMLGVVNTRPEIPLSTLAFPKMSKMLPACSVMAFVPRGFKMPAVAVETVAWRVTWS